MRSSRSDPRAWAMLSPSEPTQTNRLGRRRHDNREMEQGPVEPLNQHIGLYTSFILERGLPLSPFETEAEQNPVHRPHQIDNLEPVPTVPVANVPKTTTPLGKSPYAIVKQHGRATGEAADSNALFGKDMTALSEEVGSFPTEEPEDPTTNTKRGGDIATQTGRASKRRRDEFGSEAVSHGEGVISATTSTPHIMQSRGHLSEEKLSIARRRERQLPQLPQVPAKTTARVRLPPLLQGLHQPPPLPSSGRLFPPITHGASGHIEHFTPGQGADREWSNPASAGTKGSSQTRLDGSVNTQSDVTICSQCDRRFTGIYQRDDYSRHVRQKHSGYPTQLNSPRYSPFNDDRLPVRYELLATGTEYVGHSSNPISIQSDIQYTAGWIKQPDHIVESSDYSAYVHPRDVHQHFDSANHSAPTATSHDSSATEMTPTQPPAKARDFSGMNHLPSDSGYQSGIGTDTESVISDISTGSSLVVSADLVHDFVAFFGDTLIKKAGAQQWAQFAMAYNPQSEIEKRLTALLRAFAIDLAARRSTSMALDDGKVHPVHDDESVRVLLDGAIKLVRRYRPMIARYFLENSINDKAEAVSLSDRLQGLGRHFSLAERVDLLVHRGVRDVDEGDKGDEDEDDNVVDEDIVPQLEPVQAMLVSGDAFRHLASELRRSLYRDDSYGMTTIRNVVLKSVTSSNTSTPCWATATFLAKWDVMRFMRSQYSKIPSVASVLVLTGSALYAQATTCGEYVRKHWPTTGSIFLDILDKVLVSDADRTATIELEFENCPSSVMPSMCMHIRDGGIALSAGPVPKDFIVEIAQLLAWAGSALSNSSFGESLAYGLPSVVGIRDAGTLKGPDTPTKVIFDITYGHEKLHITETSCWLPLFNGMTIVTGFPIASRGEEIGLEISLELLAAIAGVSHVTKFDDGLVMKGFSSLILPVQKTEDRVQWHAITSQHSDTYLGYHDGLSRCESRLLSQELGFDDLKSTRAFLGWCSVYTSRLGSGAIDYDNIDYSGAGEASTSIRLNGAQVGFQQWATATANFSIGAKQTKHYIGRDGPFRNIMSTAERTPILLYDTAEKRGYLVTATDVMLHIIQHRHRLEPYEVNNKPVVFETGVSIGSTAKETLKRHQNMSLSDDDSYTFKHAIHSIWSILEDLRAKTVSKNQGAEGIAIEGPFFEHLQGYEYKAIVQERGVYTLKEKALSGKHGGWPILVRETNALVLLADGFGDLILPSDDHKSRLCNVWQRVPQGCDYLATTCRVLADLYEEAGSRASREHLTTTHLQWDQGTSQLFESCSNTQTCNCNRLQRIVRKSDTVVRPNIGNIKAGAVIFGNHNSLLQKLTSTVRSKVVPKQPFYYHANATLDDSCHHSDILPSIGFATCDPNATTIVLSSGDATCAIRPTTDLSSKEPAPDAAQHPMSLGKKRYFLPDPAFPDHDQKRQSYEQHEHVPSLKRKQAFPVRSAGRLSEERAKTTSPISLHTPAELRSYEHNDSQRTHVSWQVDVANSGDATSIERRDIPDAFESEVRNTQVFQTRDCATTISGRLDAQLVPP